MGYADGTTVDVSRTVEQIKRELRKYGATKFAQFETESEAAIAFSVDDLNVKMRIDLPQRCDDEFNLTANGKERTDSAASRLWETEVRRRWRCLLAVIKAKLIAVAEKVATIEEEFLPYIVLADGGTVGDRIIPMLSEPGQTVLTKMLPPAADAPQVIDVPSKPA